MLKKNFLRSCSLVAISSVKKYTSCIVASISEPRRPFHWLLLTLKYSSKILNSLIMAFRFLEYCGTNNATVEVGRKEKVEDIADTLRRLNLYSAASSGEKRRQSAQFLSKNNTFRRFNYSLYIFLFQNSMKIRKSVSVNSKNTRSGLGTSECVLFQSPSHWKSDLVSFALSMTINEQ